MSRLGERLRAWRGRRALAQLAGPQILEALAETYPEVFFVEVGANDGQRRDYLRPLITSRPWRGILVEPVPFVFAQLERIYGRTEGVALENVAIAKEDGERPFYHLVPAEPTDQVPDWYDQIGSFSREHVLAHRDEIPDIEDRLACITVPCLTFESLCRKHGVSDVHLLLIDAEGYDGELVRSLDLSERRPRLLVYEHFHLKPEERKATREYVEAGGFEVIEEGFDSWALDVDPDDGLVRSFRRMRPAVAGVSAHDR